MSYTIGTWDAPPDGPLAGTRVDVTRADGKGFTALRVTGPRAAEIRDFVAASATVELVRQPRHVRCALPDDHTCGTRAVSIYGRLRQTRDVITRALEHYSFHLASTMPGIQVPIIRLVPPAAPYTDAPVDTP